MSLPRKAEKIIKSAEAKVKRGKNPDTVFTVSAKALAKLGLDISTHSLALARLAEAIRGKDEK